MKSVPSLQALLFELEKLPGIGAASAKRLARHILNAGDIQALAQAIERVKSRIQKCQKCYSWTEGGALCQICQDPRREQGLLCVVEQPFDVLKVEDCGCYKGFYHVLHGAISPLRGMRPEDLTLAPLFQRLKSEPVKELILALDSDIEGDTTALYISKMTADQPISLSKLARGIPFGGDLDFVDDRTLSQALQNRSAF